MVFPVFFLTLFTTIFGIFASALYLEFLDLPTKFTSISIWAAWKVDLVYPFIFLKFNDQHKIIRRNFKIANNFACIYLITWRLQITRIWIEWCFSWILWILLVTLSSNLFGILSWNKANCKINFCCCIISILDLTITIILLGQLDKPIKKIKNCLIFISKASQYRNFDIIAFFNQVDPIVANKYKLKLHKLP